MSALRRIRWRNLALFAAIAALDWLALSGARHLFAALFP